MTVVSLGPFTGDTDDTTRVVVTVEGWADAAPISDGVSDRGQQDGGWDGTGFYRPRVVTLTGLVDVPSHAEAVAVADLLTSLAPQAVYPLTVVDTVLGARQSMVRVSTGAVLTWSSDRQFTYTLQTKAADPVKYGTPTFATAQLTASGGGTGLVYPLAYPLDYGVPAGVTPGAVAVANVGSAVYWPRLRIGGPVPNPVVTLVETGDYIRFAGTVAAGQWLDVDCAARRVLLNGQVSVRANVSSSGSWLAVPPGGGSVTWTADAADPAALLSVWAYEGAWI